MTFVEQSPFWTLLEKFGNAPALVTADRSMSFAELAEEADRLAAEFTAQAGRDGRLLIAVVMSPQIHVIAAYLGALRAGHVVLLSDESILSKDSQIAQRFEFDLRISGDARGLTLAPHPKSPLPGVELHPDLALLLSTSGSTGDPKLVRLSATAVQSNAASIVEYLGVRPDSRAITTLPLFYSYGMSVLHSQLTAGGALILTDASVTDPAFWQLARDHGATSLALVPHQVELIARSPMSSYPLPGLRYVTQAGGRLPPDQVCTMAKLGQKSGWNFFVMYGQTEAAPRISYVPPDRLLGAAGTIGKAIPGGHLEIRTDKGQRVSAVGQPGELIYSGPNVMMGYASAPAELSHGNETPELATGDLAEWTEDGFVRIVGRLKRFVKLYGMRISLDQIEAHLASHGISAHAVGNDSVLVLFVDPQIKDQKAADLVADLIEVPVNDIVVRPLAQTPLLASGKIDYRGLDTLAANVLAEEAVASTSKKLDLREVMAHATRSRTISDDNSFNDLGGDSLGFLQVTMAIEARLGYVPDDWEKIPVGQLMQLKPSATPRSQLGMDVVVRILAISLIVINHTLDGGFNGGTWVLLMTLGLSFFRFQLPALDTQSPGRILFKMFYPVIPLYFIILGALVAVGKDVPLPLFTLTADFVTDSSAFYFNVNWFVSLYVQLLVLLVLVFSRPAIQNYTRAQPFVVASGFFGLALVGSLAWQGWLYLFFDSTDPGLIEAFHVRSPLTCLPMVALGAMIATANGKTQQLIVLGAVVVNAIVFPVLSWVHFISLLIGGGLLTSGWVLSVPLWLGRVARKMASAALFVYLLHVLVLRIIIDVAHLDTLLGPFLLAGVSLPLSFLVSSYALAVFRFIEAWALKRLWPRYLRMVNS
jgi:acyl-CoA synthetase (AMP-forming)/AMP-acid ligase II